MGLEFIDSLVTDAIELAHGRKLALYIPWNQGDNTIPDACTGGRITACEHRAKYPYQAITDHFSETTQHNSEPNADCSTTKYRN